MSLDLGRFYVAGGAAVRMLTAGEARDLLAAVQAGALALEALGKGRDVAHCECCQTTARIANDALREMAVFVAQKPA